MNKAFLVISSLAFSIFIIVSSFFYFGLKKSVDGNVMGLKNSNELQIPLNSIFINEDSSQNGSSVAYTTALTKDQILKYYSALGKLEGWEQEVDPTEFIQGDTHINIKIQNESEGRNLVTVEYKIN